VMLTPELGEGTSDEFPPPVVDTRSKNFLNACPGGSRSRQAEVPLPGGTRPWLGCFSA
jgi:hypothetical protein